jgi:hypothetical protein
MNAADGSRNQEELTDLSQKQHKNRLFLRLISQISVENRKFGRDILQKTLKNMGKKPVSLH